jgi:hypothetical protein
MFALFVQDYCSVLVLYCATEGIKHPTIAVSGKVGL